jgi:hypothetical protein
MCPGLRGHSAQGVSAVNDLAEFLLARADEDERIAHLAARPGVFTGVEPWAVWSVKKPARGEVHMNPERALSECEAKRRVVERWRLHNWPPSCAALTEDDAAFDRGMAQGFEEAMQLLALPYAAHPDYMDEWRL